MVCSFRVLFLPSLERNSRKNTIYLSQNVSFRAPVKIGDTLRVVAEVIKNVTIKIITLQTNIYNQSDDIVVEGTATIKKSSKFATLFLSNNF